MKVEINRTVSEYYLNVFLDTLVNMDNFVSA